MRASVVITDARVFRLSVERRTETLAVALVVPLSAAATIKESLRLELDGGESRVLHSGEALVIPAGTPFRGYPWPRNGGPCLFLAVAPAGATFTRL